MKIGLYLASFGTLFLHVWQPFWAQISGLFGWTPWNFRVDEWTKCSAMSGLTGPGGRVVWSSLVGGGRLVVSFSLVGVNEESYESVAPSQRTMKKARGKRGVEPLKWAVIGITFMKLMILHILKWCTSYVRYYIKLGGPSSFEVWLSGGKPTFNIAQRLVRMQIVAKNTEWSWKEAKCLGVVAAGTLSWVCITSYQLIYSMITTSALTNSQIWCSRRQWVKSLQGPYSLPKGSTVLPPETNGWNLKIIPLKRKIIFQTSIFGFQPLVFGSVMIPETLKVGVKSCSSVKHTSNSPSPLQPLTTLPVATLIHFFWISKTTFEKPVVDWNGPKLENIFEGIYICRLYLTTFRQFGRVQMIRGLCFTYHDDHKKMSEIERCLKIAQCADLYRNRKLKYSRISKTFLNVSAAHILQLTPDNIIESHPSHWHTFAISLQCLWAISISYTSLFVTFPFPLNGEA